MINVIKQNKWLVLFGMFFLIMMSFLFVKTVIGFNNLRQVNGIVSKYEFEGGHRSKLKLTLASDNRLYYQSYEKRFRLSEEISVNQKLTFYTFNYPVVKSGAISNQGNQNDFSYYPVFYVDSQKGILELLYFYLYSDDGFGLLLGLSLVLFLFSAFPLVLQKKLVS